MNQSINQLRDLFLSMTPAARITAGLLLGVIVVSLGFLFQQHRGGADEYLFNETLSSREMNNVVAAISQKNLSDFKVEGGWIRVPSGQKAAYWAAVADAGALPANFDTLMSEALQGNAFDSRPVQQQRIKSVLQRQLSMMVSKMAGVEHADVLYDVHESGGFQKRQVSATVSVQPAAGETLTPRRGKLIRAAVAGAIAGLKPADVQILNLADGSMDFAGAEISPEAFDDPYYQTRTRYEQLMQGRFASLLNHIPGVRVQVSADLDQTLTMERRKVSADGDAKLIREGEETESVKNTRVESGGQPGLTAQGPGARPVDEETSTVISETEIKDVDNQYFPSTTEELLTQAGLVPTDVRVTVAIPSEYAVKVWREQNPDAAEDDQPTTDQLNRIKGDTTTTIEGSIKPLLPEQQTKEQYARVINVSFFQSLTPEEVEPPSAASEALFWAGNNANTLLTAGFALVGLVMLRSMVKSIPPAEPGSPVGQSALALEMPGADRGPGGEAGAAGGDDEEGGDQRPKLKLKKGSSLRDDLTEVVREDPDAAAAILRSWINQAA